MAIAGRYALLGTLRGGGRALAPLRVEVDAPVAPATVAATLVVDPASLRGLGAGEAPALTDLALADDALADDASSVVLDTREDHVLAAYDEAGAATVVVVTANGEARSEDLFRYLGDPASRGALVAAKAKLDAKKGVLTVTGLLDTGPAPSGSPSGPPAWSARPGCASG